MDLEGIVLNKSDRENQIPYNSTYYVELKKYQNKWVIKTEVNS